MLTQTNKNHTVNYEKVTRYKKHLLDEVRKYVTENEQINWSEIGSRLEGKNKNNELIKNLREIKVLMLNLSPEKGKSKIKLSDGVNEESRVLKFLFPVKENFF